jgi:hypothetical protein
MQVSYRPPGIKLWKLALSLIAFVLLLILASCAPGPVCLRVPPPPQVVLPQTGHFRLSLNSILQTGSTDSPTKPMTP